MNDRIFILGLILIFAGFILLVIGSIADNKNIEFIGGGFIGPIPFGFASDPRYFKWILIAILATSIALILLK